MRFENIFEDVNKTERQLRRLLKIPELPPDQGNRIRKTLEDLSRSLRKIKRQILRDRDMQARTEEALENAKQKCMELSIWDPLTGLYNLKYFYDILITEVERVNRYHFPICLLMLDIDRLNSINDRYGRLEGDAVLKRMAEIIKRYIRQVDSAYRYGEDEFLVILPETEDEEAIQVAERIRLGFKKENFSPKIDEKVHLTVSIGVARYFPKEEMISFLKRSDDNLYTAKSQGRDRVYYQEKGGESSFLM